MPGRGWGTGGSTSQWRRLRAACLSRDGYRCHWCGGVATQADHVKPRAHGGVDELDNLVAACAPCNRKRGQQTQRELRAQR